MKFKDLNFELLGQRIESLKKEVMHHIMWGAANFYEINPKQQKKIALKEEFKPEDAAIGRYTEYHREIASDRERVARAQGKLRDNQFFGQDYYNIEASLKFHISLNDIGNLDENIMLGLIKFLIDESNSLDNNMSFFFKVVNPLIHEDNRFKNNDQITIYFDKYSSAADLARLAKKIETYLQSQGVPNNQQPLGAKDSFGFNSFVSARFDTNRLLGKYDIYPFFDIELGKFFQKYAPNDIEHIPLCAFEAVFNYVIMSKEITKLPKEPKQGLSDKDSTRVQNELKKMMENPKKYLECVGKKNEAISLTVIQQQVDHFNDLLGTIKKKSDQLFTDGYPVKGKAAKDLHDALNTAFKSFEEKKTPYSEFKEQCDKAISPAKEILAIHRGWKEIILNVLAAIGSFGGSLLYQHQQTNGKHLFFTVNTDSMNIVENIEQSIDELGKNTSNKN